MQFAPLSSVSFHEIRLCLPVLRFFVLVQYSIILNCYVRLKLIFYPTQSITAQNEIHEIFALPIERQLEIIATDRELKNRSVHRKTRTPLPLSEATQKTIERRKS